MEYKDILTAVIEKSVEKNGASSPLTLGHLLNIVKYANKAWEQYKKKEEEQEEEIQAKMDEALMEIYASQCGDRD